MLTDIWIKDQTTSDKLEQMGHEFLPVNRLDRSGGRIGLLFNNNLDITRLQTDSYKYGIWKLKLDSKAITLCGIYRPPRSKVNKFYNIPSQPL